MDAQCELMNMESACGSNNGIKVINNDVEESFEEKQLKGYIDDIKQPHLPVVDRYYTKYYKTDVKEVVGQDFCILEHSNKICLITLAKSHPILRRGLRVLSVDFKADEKNNRLENKVSGKFKRGAQAIKEGSPLCHLTCDDDNVYTVYGCIRGILVEVNEALITKPHLVNDQPQSDGYIAVIMTRQHDHKKEISQLLTEQMYEDILNKREEQKSATDSAESNHKNDNIENMNITEVADVQS